MLKKLSGVWSTSWVSPSVCSWIVHTCTPWGGVLGLVPAPLPIPLDQPPPSGGAGGGTSGKINASLMQLNDVNAGRLIEHARVRRGVASWVFLAAARLASQEEVPSLPGLCVDIGIYCKA